MALLCRSAFDRSRSGSWTYAVHANSDADANCGDDNDDNDNRGFRFESYSQEVVKRQRENITAQTLY